MCRENELSCARHPSVKCPNRPNVGFEHNTTDLSLMIVTKKKVLIRSLATTLPPLAPMTATWRLATGVVENCLAAMAKGCWNLENILTLQI